MTAIHKICGVRDIAGAEACAAAKVDYVGFNFAARSHRCVTPELARELASHIGRATPIGVFENHTAQEIEAIARAADLSWIQLHGEESAELGESLSARFNIVRSLNTKTLHSASDWHEFIEFFILDGRNAGSGRAWNWRIAPGLALHQRPVVLAGGLNPENVGEAIKVSRAAGVDVASGVEVDGKQDPARIAAFVAAARQAFEERSA